MRFINHFDQTNKSLILALFLIFLLRIVTLGAYPLMDTTESRYAEIAREMVVTNNWITPQLDPGQPFWAKPPLSIWATALSFKVFGISEFSARFPSLLFAVGTVFLIFILARRLINTTFALKVSVVLSSTGLFYALAGGVMTDPALSFAITCSMVSFMLAMRKESPSMWKYVFFAGLGLSLLSKGPVGIVLTGFPIFCWTVYKKEWKRVIHSFPWIAGILIMLAIALPWHILAEMKTPGFLKYYLIGENFQRFVVPGWKGDLYGNAHSEPRGLIWLFLIPTTLPWIIILIANFQSLVRKNQLRACWSEEDWTSLVVFWFLTPMMFFTFSRNILMTYILPALPAFALLTVYCIHCCQKNTNAVPDKWYSSSRSFLYFAVIIPCLFTLAAFTILPRVGLKKSHKSIGQMFNQKDLGNSRLIYITTMPYSADFYSNGAAFPMHKDLDRDEITQYLNDEITDYFAVRDDDLDWFSQFAPRILKVKTFGRYTVFKERRSYGTDE